MAVSLNSQLTLTMAVLGVDFGALNFVIAQAKAGGIDVLLNQGSGRLNA